MFPQHCKEVGVLRVSFPLNTHEIEANLVGKEVYKLTKYLAINNGKTWALVEIEKEQGQDLFGKINKVKVISLPDSTFYTEDYSINVLSISQMANKARDLAASTLIVKGRYEHISFIHNTLPSPLFVFEVTPPMPPKLVDMVETVLGSDEIKKPFHAVPRIADLLTMKFKCINKIIMFPCHASGLVENPGSLFLDQKPNLRVFRESEICLEGCSLSLKMFQQIYGFTPEFYNMCPKELALNAHLDHPAIAKCCQVKEGFEKIGKLVIVPWGASYKEVSDAICSLTGD